MKFGFAVPAYGENAQGPAIRDLLVAGDELGFDSAWFPEHIAVPDYAARNVSPPLPRTGGGMRMGPWPDEEPPHGHRRARGAVSSSAPGRRDHRGHSGDWPGIA